MMTRLILIIFASFAALPNSLCLAGAGEDHRLDLSGAWSFRLDPEDRGIAEHWHRQEIDESVPRPLRHGVR
jgi:hypothetical protein